MENEKLTEEQKLSLVIFKTVDLINETYAKHGDVARPQLEGLKRGLNQIISGKTLTENSQKMLGSLPSFLK